MDGQLQRTGATVAFDICGWPGTISSKIMRDSWTAVSLSLVVKWLQQTILVMNSGSCMIFYKWAVGQVELEVSG